MAVGIIFVMIQTYIQIRFIYRNMDDLRFSEPRGIQELRQELGVWQRAAASLCSYTRDEDLVRETLLKKANYLERLLKKRLATGKLPVDTYNTTLKELQDKVISFKLFSLNFQQQFLLDFSDLVSYSKQESTHQVCDRTYIYHNILLPSCGSRNSKIVDWLGCIIRCHFIAHIS